MLHTNYEESNNLEIHLPEKNAKRVTFLLSFVGASSPFAKTVDNRVRMLQSISHKSILLNAIISLQMKQMSVHTKHSLDRDCVPYLLLWDSNRGKNKKYNKDILAVTDGTMENILRRVSQFLPT